MEMETIRSGFTPDGQRVFLEFDAERRLNATPVRAVSVEGTVIRGDE